MISFIVLHYKNIEETIECLKQLKKLNKNNNISIIVVDNNTLTASEEKEVLIYTKDILKLDKNYGFAKANNKGIKYAETKYKPDFVCVINNDVFIYDNNFIDIILKDYKKYKFDILGPFIDSPTGESINPFPVLRKEEITKEINKCEKLIKIYSSKTLTFLLNIYLKTKSKLFKRTLRTNGDTLIQNVPLHGCAIIFSKQYIKKYEYPFINDTFLFHEEEFLYYRVQRDNLISVYDPNLKVFHKEGSSVNKTNKNIRTSKLFREKERLKSLILLKKEVEVSKE